MGRKEGWKRLERNEGSPAEELWGEGRVGKKGVLEGWQARRVGLEGLGVVWLA